MALAQLSLFPEELGRILGRRKVRRTLLLSQNRTKEFNVALLDLTDGRGSVVRNLAIVTGMTPDAVKSRVKRARFDYTDEDRDPSAADLDPDESRYFASVYKDSNDPAVREWIGSTCNNSTRKNPAWRSKTDGKKKERKPYV